MHAAYEVLRDPAKRDQYDAQRNEDDHWEDKEGYGYSEGSDSDFAFSWAEFIRKMQASARRASAEGRGPGLSYESYEDRHAREQHEAWARMEQVRAELRASEQKRWKQAQETRRTRAEEEKKLKMEREEDLREDAIAQEERLHGKYTKTTKKAKQAASRKNCTCQGCRDRFVREQSEKDQQKSDPDGYAQRLKIRKVVAVRKEKEATEKAQQDAEREARDEATAKKKMKKEAQDKAARECAQQRLAKHEATQKAKAQAQAAAEKIANRIRLEQLAQRQAKEAAEREAHEARIEAERNAKEAAESRAKEAAERAAADELHRLAEEAREALKRDAAERKAKEVEKQMQEEVAQQKAKEEAERKARQVVDDELPAMSQPVAEEAASAEVKGSAAAQTAKESGPPVVIPSASSGLEEAAERGSLKRLVEVVSRQAQDAQEAVVTEQPDHKATFHRTQESAEEQNKQPAKETIKVAQKEDYCEEPVVGSQHPRVDWRAAVRCKFGERCKHHSHGKCCYLHVDDVAVNNAPVALDSLPSKVAESQVSVDADVPPGEGLAPAPRVKRDGRSKVRCKFGKHCKHLLHGGCVYYHTNAELTLASGDKEHAETHSHQSPDVSSPTRQGDVTGSDTATPQLNEQVSANANPQVHPSKSAKSFVCSTSNPTNRNPSQSAEQTKQATPEVAALNLLASLSLAARLKISKTYIQATKDGAMLALFAEGKHVPAEGIVVDLAWVKVNAGHAAACSFCNFKNMKYSFQCCQGGAVACKKCKKNLGTVTPDDEAVLLGGE